MKKIMPLLVASGILLFGFQNCSQQKLISDTQNNHAGPAPTKVEDPTLAQAQSLDIFTMDVLTRSDQKISLDLGTGELVQGEKGVIVRKCLSEDMRSKIYDVFNSAQLCEFAQPAADMACAQVYGPPYSEIHWSNKSIKVGESMSSCHKGMDLCGNDALLLRSLLREIIARWSEWSCDFKVVVN